MPGSALIQLLAWEPPHAAGAALKKKKKTKNKKVKAQNAWVQNWGLLINYVALGTCLDLGFPSVQWM